MNPLIAIQNELKTVGLVLASSVNLATASRSSWALARQTEQTSCKSLRAFESGIAASGDGSVASNSRQCPSRVAAIWWSERWWSAKPSTEDEILCVAKISLRPNSRKVMDAEATPIALAGSMTPDLETYVP